MEKLMHSLEQFLKFPEPKPDITPTLSSAAILNKTILCNTAVKYNPDIRTALASDELAQEISLALANGSKQHTKVPLG